MFKSICLLACSFLLGACVCQVQTSEAIALHGQECEGVIIPGWGKCAPEFYQAGGRTYVKGIRIRLERVNTELAWYQCPTTIEEYMPVEGAEQVPVYVVVNGDAFRFPADEYLTALPAGASPGITTAVAVPSMPYKICCSMDAARPDPVVCRTPMRANERSWYTTPLSWLSFVAVDIPGTIVGSAFGAVYTLLSPDESFFMQYDEWGYSPQVPFAGRIKPGAGCIIDNALAQPQ